MPAPLPQAVLLALTHMRFTSHGHSQERDPVDSDSNPDLENQGRDVKFQTDFRSVYARAIDDWLGADSVSILGGDFRNSAVNFV